MAKKELFNMMHLIGFKRAGFAFLICLILAILTGPIASPLHAANMDGRIVVSKTGSLHVELSFKNRAPKAAIVTLMLPKGAEIAEARPALSAFDKATGEARWLIKEPDHRPIKLDLSLRPPTMSSKGIKGSVTFLDPATGKQERLKLPVTGR
jgi:hypothetical protein